MCHSRLYDMTSSRRHEVCVVLEGLCFLTGILHHIRPVKAPVFSLRHPLTGACARRIRNRTSKAPLLPWLSPHSFRKPNSSLSEREGENILPLELHTCRDRAICAEYNKESYFCFLFHFCPPAFTTSICNKTICEAE